MNRWPALAWALLLASVAFFLVGYLYRPLPQAQSVGAYDIERIRQIAGRYRRSALPTSIQLFQSGTCASAFALRACVDSELVALASAAIQYERSNVLVDSPADRSLIETCRSDPASGDDVYRRWRNQLGNAQLLLFLSGDRLSFSGFAALPDVDAWREQAALSAAQLRLDLVRENGLPAPVFESMRAADAPAIWPAAPGVVSLWARGPRGDERWIYVRLQNDQEYLLFSWPQDLAPLRSRGWRLGLADRQERRACAELPEDLKQLRRFEAAGVILIPLRDGRSLRRLLDDGLLRR